MTATCASDFDEFNGKARNGFWEDFGEVLGMCLGSVGDVVDKLFFFAG